MGPEMGRDGGETSRDPLHGGAQLVDEDVHPAVRAFAEAVRDFRRGAGARGQYRATAKATGVGESTIKAIVSPTRPRLPNQETMRLVAVQWGGNPRTWLRRLDHARRESRRKPSDDSGVEPKAAPALGPGETRNLHVPPQLNHVQEEVTRFQILSKLARSGHKELMRTLNILIAEMGSESPYILTAFTRPPIPASRITEIWNEELSISDDITPIYSDWMNILYAIEDFLRYVKETDASEVSEAREWARRTAGFVQEFRCLQAEILAKHRHVK